MTRRIRAATLALVTAAACTSGPQPRDAATLDLVDPVEEPTSPVSPSPPAEAPTTPARTSDLTDVGGRLAVIDASGRLVTMTPDGTDPTVLAAVDRGTSEIQQPSWSRDGSRLAWVHLETLASGAVEGSVATARHDGSRATRTRTEIVPYYLNWDPTSSRIAYLGPLTSAEVGFGVVELGGRSRGAVLDSGRPFYFSWAPSGDELLVHAGEDRLERLPLKGLPRTVDTPAIFSAPVWTADGSKLVYGSQDDEGLMELVVHDVAAGDAEALVTFDGLILFVVSPDGSRVAYQIVGEVETGPLTVVDLASGDSTAIVDRLTAAFFWSPDSERLLYLDPDPDPEAYWYRWGIWDGETTFETPRFEPSLLMVGDYLPFFEQYAQSMSLWSPDGSAFAYPGMGEDGRTGIWVQEAEPGTAPVLVAGGDFVTWSPA